MECHFKPSDKADFNVNSGRLLIADPYHLGYSRSIETLLEQHKRTLGKNKPVIAFDNGLLYYTLTKDGYGTDGFFNVYFDNGQIKIKLDDDPDEALRTSDNPIFTALVDNCCLLIGDAGIYSVDESQWQIPDNSHTPASLRKSYEEIWKDSIRKNYQSQTFKVANGSYTFMHRLEDEVLLIKPR